MRHGLTATRYDLLVLIKPAGNEGLVISALAERLFLAPNSVTELVDRAQRGTVVARRRAREMPAQRAYRYT